MAERKKLNSEPPARTYAVGRNPGQYEAGPFKDSREAFEWFGDEGSFIFRIEGSVVTPIRWWDGTDGQWERMDTYVDPVPTEQVSNDVEVGWFENALQIDRDALDKAFIEQPVLLQRAAARYAKALSLRDAAKDHVKTVEAQLTLQVRERVPEGRKAPTEATFKAMVDTHPARRKAVAHYMRMIEDCALWEGMFESFKARGFALTELNKQWLAGYFGGDASAREQRASSYEEDREAIRAARRRRAEGQS